MSVPTESRISLFAALKTSLPVFFGYISIGFAYGFLLTRAGFSWFWAPLSSVFVFAGAAQFLSVGMLAGGASIGEIFMAILVLNARHVVYGLSMIEAYRDLGWRKWYLIFGLTDETYGLLTSVTPPEHTDPSLFFLYLTAVNQSYWILGSTLGAVFGSIMRLDVPGIEFSMTALFTVLLVEQIRSLRRVGPFVIAFVVCTVLYLIGIQEQLLLFGIIGSATLVFFLPDKRAGVPGDLPIEKKSHDHAEKDSGEYADE